MAVFLTHNVLLANGHLKNQWIFYLNCFSFCIFSSFLVEHCHLMCISPVWFMQYIYIYIYIVCVSDFGERGQFVYLHILSFVFLAYFCKFICIFSCKLKAKYYCCLNLYIFDISHFVITFLLSHWLYGNLSSVSLWPYFFFLCINLSCWI